MCLLEKGYSDEEYIVKHVDISECREDKMDGSDASMGDADAYIAKGENFAPSYLK